MESKFFKWNRKDFLKGLLMAVLVPSLVLIEASIEAGALTFDWKVLGMASLAGGVGYLLKNLFSGERQVNVSSGVGGHPDPDKEEK